MELLFGKNQAERAPRANTASFRTMKNCDVTTTGYRTIAAAGVVDWKECASTLCETAHDDKHKHNGASEGQSRYTSMRTGASVFTICSE